MIVVPAIDLRAGACVQLVGGSYAAERVRRPDAVGVALEWEREGFRRVHVVDLDAATGRGNNGDLVRAVVQATAMKASVGGGVRSVGAIEQLLADGAERVVVGTRAIEDRAWLERAATSFPGRLVVAADVRDRTVLVAGWARSAERNVMDVVAELNDLPLAGILVTAIHAEGRQQGCDTDLVRAVCGVATLPVFAAGGIASVCDLRALEACGATEAVVGMALYTGMLTGRACLEAFAA